MSATTDPILEPEGWKIDKQGREYTGARGRSGVIFRKDGETLDEALARDKKGPADKPPKRTKAPKVAKAPAPTAADVKELEFLVTEALKSPAMICIALGDQWPADHMMSQAPIFARNLTHAAEHNPWLKAKLEAMMTGEDFLIKLITTGAVGGAALMYVGPVLLYYFRPAFVPEAAAEMLGVPDRDEIHRLKAEADALQAAVHAAQSATSAAGNGAGPATG